MAIFIIEKILVSIYNSDMGNIKFLLANFIDEILQNILK